MTKNKDTALVPVEHIAQSILILRGHRVLLDADLAALYGVETRRLNEQVRRNRERFPGDFIFELTTGEFANLKSQFATSSWGGRRKRPIAFTEHGAIMASPRIPDELLLRAGCSLLNTVHCRFGSGCTHCRKGSNSPRIFRMDNLSCAIDLAPSLQAKERTIAGGYLPSPAYVSPSQGVAGMRRNQWPASGGIRSAHRSIHKSSRAAAAFLNDATHSVPSSCSHANLSRWALAAVCF